MTTNSSDGIRESSAGDLTAIVRLHEQAFGAPEGPVIARLVTELLEHPSAQPLLSLVAEQDANICGHALFTAVRIDGRACKGFILAPLAVAPDCQRKGTGKALIDHGSDELAARGADFVLVLGDPNYYARAGFTATHNMHAPYELRYPEAWMARELAAGALAKVAGTATCAAPLMQPQHW